ncbi:hypothetical protein JCM11251_001756 [Rhodosporidiobolus azoricus]
MCYSHATVFFGVFVRAIDLVYAVDAWGTLEPTFRGIDLVKSRRTKGTLATEVQSSICDVPSEVWDMVRYQLTGIEVAAAKKRLFQSLRSPPCSSGRVEVESLSGVLDCDTCRQRFLAGENIQACCDEREHRLANLLARHQLYLPFNRLVTSEPWFWDSDALSGLAFSPTLQQRLPTVSPESSNAEAIIGHETLPFDASLLNSLSPSAAGKLRAFIRLFQIEVVDPATYLDKPARMPTAGTTARKSQKPNLQPRWRLWASSECC